MFYFKSNITQLLIMKKFSWHIKTKTSLARCNKSTYHFEFTLPYLNDLIADRNNVILIKKLNSQSFLSI